MRSLLAVLALALPPAASAQTTWYVDINGTPPGSGTLSDPYTSINYALSQASTISGDVIQVAPGTYQEQVFMLAKGVHVRSTAGPSATTIDAGAGGSAVAILGTGGSMAAIEGFTLTHGSGTGTSGTQGGGVFAAASLLSIVDCVIKDNSANVGGGLYFRNCMAEVKACEVRQNATSSFGSGGGIHVAGGTVSLIDALVEDNEAGNFNAPGYGGGVYAATGFLAAKSSTIRGNVAELGGGGLYVNEGSIETCLIENNKGQYGGGILGGAGLFIQGSTLQFNDAVSTSGSGHYGGGVYGPATLEGCTLANNRAFGTAGGAHSATLVDCTILSNVAFMQSRAPTLPLAAGAFNCTLINCVITRNTSTKIPSPLFIQGGGVANSTLVGCTVFRNAALGPQASGGGLAHCDASFSAVYDNYSAGYAGGVLGGTTSHCTIVGNKAALGWDGVLDSGQGPTVVTNSIVWNNGQEIRLVPGGSSSVTYCDVKGGFPGTGNINLDPQFWNEAARDFHLLATSPCIDAGDPLSPFDPDGSPPDMGAFPYDPSYSGG